MQRSTILAAVLIAFLGATANASAQCNNPPIAHDDVYNMSANTTLSIFDADLDDNDHDPDGDPVSAFVAGPPSVGSFCGVGPTGVCYQPPSGFTGLVAIPQDATDGCTTVGADILVFVQ